MSVAAATAATNAPRTWSLGIVKIQVFDLPFVSGNTTCTVTADTMSTVFWGLLTGVTQTAAPTYATNVATFTFTDPAATIKGQAFVIGV